MKIHEPKTIKEAIDDLQIFLHCDLYTKFRPDEYMEEENFIREDTFLDEKEFKNYLDDHFNILRKQIKRLSQKK